MKKWNSVLLLLLCVCLLSSIIVNIIVVRELGSARVMSFRQITRSSPLDVDDITATYVNEGSNPDLRGEFNDPELVEQALNILYSGCYQRGRRPKFNKSPGSGTFPFIRITTNKHTYGIAVFAEQLRISIDGESSYYYSNVNYEFWALIDEILETHFDY